MKRVGVGLTLMAVIALLAMGGSSSAQSFAESAHFTSGPSDEDIAGAWPAAAKQAGVQGEARIECRVTALDALEGCIVLQETPQGQGFGQAALGLTAKFKAQAARVGGRPTEGVVRFILRFPPSAQISGPEAVGPYTFPETAERPTDDELFAAWPGVARANHVEGWAKLSCVVSLYGRLQDCAVTEESPSGLGFGEGAMRVKDKYRFLPGTKDTMSISMRMSVQVSFECKARCSPVRLPEDFVGKFVSVSWSQVPSGAEVAAAYPKNLDAEHRAGKAVLFCRLQSGGGANRCKVLSEEPQGQGIGAAALSLVPKFKATFPKDFDGAGVQIPIAFADEPGKPVLVRRPASADFASLLSKAAADPKVTDASVNLDCTVGVAGELANCKASGENPIGLGLAEPALALAGKFGVSQWGENGRPTEGSTIKVPLSLTVRDPPKVTDPPVVSITDPQWLRRPSASDMARFYPQDAISDYRSGVARLSCKVNGAGDLYDCTVASEAPTGLGFGKAALRLAPLFKMKPVSIDGHPVQGATVNVPIIFRIE